FGYNFPTLVPKNSYPSPIGIGSHSADLRWAMPDCVSLVLCRLVVVLLIMLASVPGAKAQADVQGQWSTASYQIPVNPVHSALLNNGKILVIAGSGNCPPSMSGCPSG